MGRLTAKQQAFINHYLVCFNAAEAARLAGYKEKSARQVGYENLTKPYIREEIQKRVDALTMTADEALIEMSKIARANIGAYVDRSGLDVEKMVADGLGHLIKSAKCIVTQWDSRLEVDIYDKQSALRDILKIHGKYGPLGTADDPVQHAITYIKENRPDDD